MSPWWLLASGAAGFLAGPGGFWTRQSTVEARILALLQRSSEPISTIEIAHILNVSLARMWIALARMEGRKIIDSAWESLRPGRKHRLRLYFVPSRAP
jgi:DNA-binding transcriptional regulator GbsR (MarR family)